MMGEENPEGGEEEVEEEGGEEEGGCGLGRAESSGWRRVRGRGH